MSVRPNQMKFLHYIWDLAFIIISTAVAYNYYPGTSYTIERVSPVISSSDLTDATAKIQNFGLQNSATFALLSGGSVTTGDSHLETKGEINRFDFVSGHNGKTLNTLLHSNFNLKVNDAITEFTAFSRKAEQYPVSSQVGTGFSPVAMTQNDWNSRKKQT
jgi:hypothetical protein